jgi:hypothetical protein
MKRKALRNEESYWPGACFFRALGSGPVRQLRRRYLGVPGLHFPPMPTLALGSTAVAVAEEDGSTAAAMVAEGG